MLTRKAYSNLTGLKGKEQDAARQTDAAKVVSATKSRFLVWLVSVVNSIQETAKSRTDGELKSGMRETIALDVAKRFNIASVAIRVIGAYSELKGDAVAALMDLWSQGILTEDNVAGDGHINESVLSDIRAMIGARNFLFKLGKLRVLFKSEVATATSYDSMREILFRENAADYARSLLSVALGENITEMEMESLREEIKTYNRAAATAKALNQSKPVFKSETIQDIRDREADRNAPDEPENAPDGWTEAETDTPQEIAA